MLFSYSNNQIEDVNFFLLQTFANKIFRTTNANNIGFDSLSLRENDEISRYQISIHLMIWNWFKCWILFKVEFNFEFSQNYSMGRLKFEILFFLIKSFFLIGQKNFAGIISTPDAVLQAVIKRALIDSFCPSEILNELMENAHERRWPSGLNTLETRQINRNYYIDFVCKRVPNKQAVILLACDNRHMPSHLVVEPGVILIFAHGVEWAGHQWFKW